MRQIREYDSAPRARGDEPGPRLAAALRLAVLPAPAGMSPTH